LLSGSQDANLTVNEYGIITDVNAQAMSLLEAEYDKLVGSEFGGLFGSRDKGRVLLRKCLALGKITGVPQKFSCRSKTFFAFCDAMSYRDRNDGLIHGILVAFRPISEEIYNELIHSQNYARGLIESSIDPMVALDRDGMITDVNESTISITGWTREKLIGSFFRDYFTEPDRAGGGIKHVLAYNYVRDYELELMTCGGDVIPVSFNASIFRNPDGIPVGIFAIARDIRSARHASKKLEEMYGYARGLIESSIDPMVALDSDGVITDVNEATMSITGRARGELIGSFFKNYFTEPAKAGDGIRQVLEHDFVRDYRLDLKAPEGKVIPVSFNASIYRKPDGVPAGIFAIARVL
jgi:PAS domain S-box-containing protein